MVRAKPADSLQRAEVAAVAALHCAHIAAAAAIAATHHATERV